MAQSPRRTQYSLITARKSTRLEGYDYSSEGAYFVNLVTKNRECLFGEIVNEEMVLNELGKIVVEEWERSANIREEIKLGEYVVMPNHFHGIVHIFNDTHGKGDRPVALTKPQPDSRTKPHGPAPKSLGSLIAGFKPAVTKRINILRQTPGSPVWQRNYYDHIIGTDKEYAQIEEYILDNPRKWAWDEENRPTA